MRKRKPSQPEDKTSKQRQGHAANPSDDLGETATSLSSKMLTRRKFLTYAAGAGMIAGMSPTL